MERFARKLSRGALVSFAAWIVAAVSGCSSTATPSHSASADSVAIDYDEPMTCAGAVGPNCSLRSGIPGLPIGNTCDIVDPSNPAVVECDVSIGSLAHDTCCVEYPNGYECNGPGTPTLDCVEAWNRAQSDYLAGNAWRQQFTAGVPVDSSWAAVTQADRESTYWAPSNPDFYNDALCISNTTYQLSAPQEASFCCNIPSDYTGTCD